MGSSDTSVVITGESFVTILVDAAAELLRPVLSLFGSVQSAALCCFALCFFVTHCGIDGYTRMVIFLECSTNNQATTVYKLFLTAVERYGLPSRLGCDQGGENILVAQHMIHHRGEGRRSVIVGSSVHNQRVERLWRDMHRCVILLFYRLFYFMDNQGILDPVSERNLYALNYVFLPCINLSLSKFQEGWNNHGIIEPNSI